MHAPEHLGPLVHIEGGHQDRDVGVLWLDEARVDVDAQRSVLAEDDIGRDGPVPVEGRAERLKNWRTAGPETLRLWLAPPPTPSAVRSLAWKATRDPWSNKRLCRGLSTAPPSFRRSRQPAPPVVPYIYREKTTLYLPEDLKRAVKRAAAARGVSEAEIIRESIRGSVGGVRRRPRGALYASRQPIARRAEEMLAGFGES